MGRVGCVRVRAGSLGSRLAPLNASVHHSGHDFPFDFANMAPAVTIEGGGVLDGGGVRTIFHLSVTR